MQIHMLKICKKRKLERGGGGGGVVGEKEKISRKDSMSKDIKNAHKWSILGRSWEYLDFRLFLLIRIHINDLGWMRRGEKEQQSTKTYKVSFISHDIIS